MGMRFSRNLSASARIRQITAVLATGIRLMNASNPQTRASGLQAILQEEMLAEYSRLCGRSLYLLFCEEQNSARRACSVLMLLQ